MENRGCRWGLAQSTFRGLFVRLGSFSTIKCDCPVTTAIRNAVSIARRSRRARSDERSRRAPAHANVEAPVDLELVAFQKLRRRPVRLHDKSTKGPYLSMYAR